MRLCPIINPKLTSQFRKKEKGHKGQMRDRKHTKHFESLLKSRESSLCAMENDLSCLRVKIPS